MNGSRIYGEAVQHGVSTVTANFNSLTATAELSVFDRIDLKPQIVVLPYDANSPKGSVDNVDKLIQIINSNGFF